MSADPSTIETKPGNGPAKPRRPLTCWIVTDGKAGTESQCIGLTNALALKPEVKRIKLRAPWRWLTPYLRGFERFAFSRAGDQLVPRKSEAWPDILIGAGRRSLPAAFAARRAMGNRIALIQLQDPHCALDRFDLVIAPQHDQLTGSNVFTTRGGLHKLTPATVERAASALENRLNDYPKPYVAVVIGGKSRSYNFDSVQMQGLINQLKLLLQSFDGSLLITTSRRTGAENLQLLQRELGGDPRIWIWDNTGDNPYPGIIGLADWILVTEDSTSMVSEATVTGKPVYVIQLTGGSERFKRFHSLLREAGITRPFTGILEHWHYSPLLETQRAAQAVRKVLDQKFGVTH